jgi:hypothetical protein
MTGSALWHRFRSQGRRLRTIRNIYGTSMEHLGTSFNIFEDDGERTHISPSFFLVFQEEKRLFYA